jgi:hypothetical protein
MTERFGWTKEAMEHMVKLDSFIKEALRLNPLSAGKDIFCNISAETDSTHHTHDTSTLSFPSLRDMSIGTDDMIVTQRSSPARPFGHSPSPTV